MQRVDLSRFKTALTRRQLPAALLNPAEFETEPLDLTVDLGPVLSVWAQLRESKAPPSSWDRELAPLLHKTCRLTRRDAADMRFWHWMCVTSMPDFVWHRWYGRVPEDITAACTPAMAGRFLGTPTLNGVSRNALARMWWCAESLHSPEDGYGLARVALSNQDLFQAVFERKLGLHQPTARACFRALQDGTEESRRDAVRRLNHYLTTIVAEGLTESGVVALLQA